MTQLVIAFILEAEYQRYRWNHKGVSRHSWFGELTTGPAWVRWRKRENARRQRIMVKERRAIVNLG